MWVGVGLLMTELIRINRNRMSLIRSPLEWGRTWETWRRPCVTVTAAILTAAVKTRTNSARFSCVQQQRGFLVSFAMVLTKIQ